MRREVVMVDGGCGVYGKACLCTGETLCERSSGMSLICESCALAGQVMLAASMGSLGLQRRLGRAQVGLGAGQRRPADHASTSLPMNAIAVFFVLLHLLVHPTSSRSATGETWLQNAIFCNGKNPHAPK